MGVDEIRSYISSNLKRGISFSETKAALLRQGSSDFEITQALESMGKQNDISTPSRMAKLSNIDGKLRMYMFALGSIIFIAIILISIFILFRGGKFGERYFEVTSPVVEGKYLSLSKKNVIEIDYQGEKSEISVLVKDRTYFFTGFGANIILESGGEETVDFNLDGKPDFSFSNEGADGDNILYLKEICQEDWSCESWGDCVNGTRERKCFDLNECFSIVSMPGIIEVC